MGGPALTRLGIVPAGLARTRSGRDGHRGTTVAAIAGTGPLPAEVALHELVDVTVEDRGDVAALHPAAQVLDHLVRLQHVVADLAPPAHLRLLAPGDALELELALLLGPRRDHGPQAVHRLLPVLQLAALLL